MVRAKFVHLGFSDIHGNVHEPDDNVMEEAMPFMLALYSQQPTNTSLEDACYRKRKKHNQNGSSSYNSKYVSTRMEGTFTSGALESRRQTRSTK